MMADHPVGARPCGFFIAYRQKDYIPVQRRLFSLQYDHDHKLRQTFILHVLSTSPVHRSVDDGAAKRRDFPVRSVARDYIHMVQQNDGALCLGGGMRNTRPKVCAAGSIFEYDVLDSFLVENLLEEGSRALLIAGRVGGVDAQILL